MSEDIQFDVRIDPNEEITDAKKVILLNQWRQKVEKELVDYSASKEVVAKAFRKQKERYDGILAVKIKKMKKYDMVINSRKKVLADIASEIDKLTAVQNNNL
jgi:DNA-binding Lrp family transcriptional regulator